MKILAGSVACAAALGCGAGARTATPPTTLPPTSRLPEALVVAPLRYQVRAPLVYEFARFDSLSYQPSAGGTPQASDKTGLLMANPGREHDQVEVVLQSLAAAPGTRLAVSSLDSAAGSRWQVRLGQRAPLWAAGGPSQSVLVEQVGVIVGLLFPQLPRIGVRVMDSWTDSASYRIRVDAFDAVESAIRTSKAVGDATGVVVEAVERLARSGSVSQGGQAMALSGGGARTLSYVFSAQGFVTSLLARDSLDLRVRVEATGEIIPVYWRSTLTARLRGAPPR